MKPYRLYLLGCDTNIPRSRQGYLEWDAPLARYVAAQHREVYRDMRRHGMSRWRARHLLYFTLTNRYDNRKVSPA